MKISHNHDFNSELLVSLDEYLIGCKLENRIRNKIVSDFTVPKTQKRRPELLERTIPNTISIQ